MGQKNSEKERFPHGLKRNKEGIIELEGFVNPFEENLVEGGDHGD